MIFLFTGKGETKPHFNHGKKTDLGNYRPVSLTLKLEKIMEQVFPETMLRHMEYSTVVGDNRVSLSVNHI